MSGIGRRLRKDEDGYALVISVILLFVMMMLLVVGLQAGNSALEQSQRGIEWTRTLTVAESGINDAMGRLSGDRNAISPCPTSGTTPCMAEGGEYQVDWSGSGGSVVITSTGYYPALDTAEITRTVRVTLEPAPTFRYALFSEDFLEVKNNPVVTGDMYSQVGVDDRQQHHGVRRPSWSPRGNVTMEQQLACRQEPRVLRVLGQGRHGLGRRLDRRQQRRRDRG